MDGIEILESGSKGKGIFAARKFSKGEDVFSEKPLVTCQFSWSKFYNYTACDHCMKSMETPQNMARRLSNNYELHLPYEEKLLGNFNKEMFTKCDDCGVQYCCSECLGNAKRDYHQVLCMKKSVKDPQHPFNILDEAWRNMHFPPETSTIMLILRIVAMFIQSENRQALQATFNQFFQNLADEKHKFSHKLLGGHFQDQIKLLHSLLADAISFESLPMLSSVEGLHVMLALIGMNAQGIGTSSLSEYVYGMDEFRENTLSESESEQIDALIDKVYDDIEKEVGEFINCEGSGLYITQSKCNHSCDPNAEINFKNGNTSELTVTAIKDINENEEITICYLDECQRERSRHSRRKILRDNYLFDCTCIKCEFESELPDETSSEEEESGDEMD